MPYVANCPLNPPASALRERYPGGPAPGPGPTVVPAGTAAAEPAGGTDRPRPDHDKEKDMADTLLVLATTGFFGLCVAYVRGCARIIGDAPALADPGDATGTPDPAPEPAVSR